MIVYKQTYSTTNTLIKLAHLKLFVAVLLFFFSAIALAQDLKVTATLDSNSILIGQQTKLHLTVSYRGDKGNVQITWPTLKDTIIEKVEIVEISKIDTTIPNPKDPLGFVQSQEITITSFDSGYYALPPLKFILNSDTGKTYETEALLLQVNNVALDTTAAIKDIKQPIEEPFSWKELIPYLYWGIPALAVIAIIIFLVNRLSKREKIIPVKEEPKDPPHIIALAALEALKKEQLWQNGKTKLYHSKLSDIIRQYIEARFKVQALEQTSDELLTNMRSVVIDDESKAKLRQLLSLADLVKFAKEHPLPQENEMSLANAEAFINGTSRDNETTTPVN